MYIFINIDKVPGLACYITCKKQPKIQSNFSSSDSSVFEIGPFAISNCQKIVFNFILNSDLLIASIPFE